MCLERVACYTGRKTTAEGVHDVCVSVCVCARARERERERESSTKT